MPYTMLSPATRAWGWSPPSLHPWHTMSGAKCRNPPPTQRRCVYTTTVNECLCEWVVVSVCVCVCVCVHACVTVCIVKAYVGPFFPSTPTPPFSPCSLTSSFLSPSSLPLYRFGVLCPEMDVQKMKEVCVVTWPTISRITHVDTLNTLLPPPPFSDESNYL